jgi:hypothetical protein
MDWFERLTGLDPDGGSGSFELVILISFALLVVLAVRYVQRSRR